jgi:hypothetical protein
MISRPIEVVIMRTKPMRIRVLPIATMWLLLANSTQAQILLREKTLLTPAPAGPVITGLSDSSGAPQHQLSIMGAGFGEMAIGNESARQVHFVMNGQDVLAQINGYWTDTRINVLVPTIPTALSGRAEIYVVAPSGARSTSQPYSYIGPVITSAEDATAQQWINITGSGFGEESREVHFVVNGQDAMAQALNYWHDNQIRVMVPTFANVIVPTRADIYVVTAAGARTAPRSFLFSPVYGTRVYCMESFPPGTTIIQPGSLQQASVWPSGVASPGCVPRGAVLHRNIELFQGHAGNDWFFMGTRLTNGWVVDNVILGVYNAQQSGAVIASFNKGTPDVATNIRWWADVGALVGVTYTIAVVIRGPVALADGWLVR